MSEAKHTPGEWSFDSYNHIQGRRANGDRCDICRIPDHPSEGDYAPNQSIDRSSWYRESEANAHLISAAPEVAEQLKIVLRMLEAAYRDLGMSTDNPRFGKARAALAKAGAR